MNNIGVQIDDTRNQNSNKKTSSKFNLIKENWNTTVYVDDLIALLFLYNKKSWKCNISHCG